MSAWDHDILDDDLDDDLEDVDDDLETDELGSDYNIPDRDVQALSGERGAALDRPKLLGSAIRLDDVPDASELKKLLHGGSAIKCICIEFTNGRKLYVKP